METETQTKARGTVARPILEKRPQDLGLYRVSATQGLPTYLTAGEVQALVQAAYDDHGILATPSWPTEAETYSAELARRGVL